MVPHTLPFSLLASSRVTVHQQVQRQRFHSPLFTQFHFPLEINSNYAPSWPAECHADRNYLLCSAHSPFVLHVESAVSICSSNRFRGTVSLAHSLLSPNGHPRLAFPIQHHPFSFDLLSTLHFYVFPFLLEKAKVKQQPLSTLG